MDQSSNRPSYRARLKYIVIRLCVAYLIALTCLYLFQRRLMYFPSTSIASPTSYGLQNTDDLSLRTEDGLTIQAWHHAAKPGMPLLLYFHGNADNLRVRAPKLAAFAEQGFGFLIISYRGFGKSEGSPSETGLYLDAEAAFSYVRDTLHLPTEKIVLYGESLGTGIAVEMATRHKVGGVILEAPYTSVRKRAQELFWWAPAFWLVHDHYDSLSKITDINAPLIVFHGENDQVIPIRHGKRLFNAANEPKIAHYFPNTGHNTFDWDVLATFMAEFCAQFRLEETVN